MQIKEQYLVNYNGILSLLIHTPFNGWFIGATTNFYGFQKISYKEASELLTQQGTALKP